MRAYGKRRGDDDPAPHELRELCISANPDVLRALADFMVTCAERMEQPGSTFTTSISDPLKADVTLRTSSSPTRAAYEP